MKRRVPAFAVGTVFLVVLTSGAAWTVTLNGTSGDDVLSGTVGVDQMLGYGGDDNLHGGPGGDVLYGGRGDDLIYARDGQIDYIYCGSGKDSYDADAIDYVAPNCEHPILRQQNEPHETPIAGTRS